MTDGNSEAKTGRPDGSNEPQGVRASGEPLAFLVGYSVPEHPVWGIFDYLVGGRPGQCSIPRDLVDVESFQHCADSILWPSGGAYGYVADGTRVVGELLKMTGTRLLVTDRGRFVLETVEGLAETDHGN